ncbi:hypothetical protein P43SY_004173 [Pythium insidiosum]|uniref:Transmembrane protein n=1 Tax=Pythium insidiosum TaxID=114742 RepID=A0AAD5Q2P5_PYTIN|nr:hypothetical protein P43SY_004173 [Pythium insidiosum]
MASWSKWLRLPVKAQLALDLALVVLFVLLDARDLAFKTRWIGPSDAFSFTTATPPLRLDARVLAPTDNVTRAGQFVTRSSGWISLRQRCQSLRAIAADEARFSHVLASDCDIGHSGAAHRAPNVVLSAGIRADSVAWAACKLLFHHRKPPICHSPVVRYFASRYNLRDRPFVIVDVASKTTGELNEVTLKNESLAAFSARPGSDAEMEVIEMLEVLSLSSSLERVTCATGFVVEGNGYYLPSLVGCASPSEHRSAFIGLLATGFKQFHHDKTWLAATTLRLSGMAYTVRENRRSLFVVKGLRSSTAASNSGNDSSETTTSIDRDSFTLEHRTRLNFSSFGTLYTVAVAVDLALLVLFTWSAYETIVGVLAPMWRTLQAPANVLARRASATKAAVSIEDCHAAVTSGIYRSELVSALLLTSCVLHWMTVVPLATLLSERTTSLQATTHALLSLGRFWVLVLLTINALWNSFVAWQERQALLIAHVTYVSVPEVAAISAFVALLFHETLLAIPRALHVAQHQHLEDKTSFAGRIAVANSFAEDQDSVQHSSSSVVAALFLPLLAVVLASLVAVVAVAAVRFAYFQARYPRQHPPSRSGSVTAASPSTVKPDLDRAADSPTKRAMAAAHSEPLAGLQLPLERVVHVPIRARSLVRSAWKMERRYGHHVSLRIPVCLEHGIIFEGSGACLKTRVGFFGVVLPYLRTQNHALPKDEQPADANSSQESTVESDDDEVNNAAKLPRTPPHVPLH